MKFENRTMQKLLFFSCMICQLQAIPNTHIQPDPINPKYPVKTVVKEATTKVSPKKKKALVAVFGVFSRSLRNTWPQINRMIVKPLEKDYDVEIYGFNNQVDNIDTLDGQPIQKSSTDTIKTNHKLVYQEVKQSQLDEYIQKDNGMLLSYKWHSWYDQKTQKNAVRQFYQEQHVSNYISDLSDDYDVVVAFIADLYPLVPLSMSAISPKDDVIYTAGPLPRVKKPTIKKSKTNGYYLGSKQSIAKAMSTVSSLRDMSQRKRNLRKNLKYESLYVNTLSIHKIKRTHTSMVFCKRRNSRECTLFHVENDVTIDKTGWLGWLTYHYEIFFVSKVIRQIRTLTYVICSLGLLVIMASKATIWYLGSIHKKAFLRKGGIASSALK